MLFGTGFVLPCHKTKPAQKTFPPSPRSIENHPKPPLASQSASQLRALFVCVFFCFFCFFVFFVVVGVGVCVNGCCHHNTTHHNTTQHTTTQHNTTQHNTTQHNTTQHNTTQQAALGRPGQPRGAQGGPRGPKAAQNSPAAQSKSCKPILNHIGQPF